MSEEYPVRIVYVQVQNEASKRAAKKYFQTHKEQIYAKRKEWRDGNAEYRARATIRRQHSRLVKAEERRLMSIVFE